MSRFKNKLLPSIVLDFPINLSVLSVTVPVAPTFKPTLGAPQTTNGELRKSSGTTTTLPNNHELTSIHDDNSYSSTVTEEDKEMVQSSTETESTTNEAEPKNCIVMGKYGLHKTLKSLNLTFL